MNFPHLLYHRQLVTLFAVALAAIVIVSVSFYYYQSVLGAMNASLNQKVSEQKEWHSVLQGYEQAIQKFSLGANRDDFKQLDALSALINNSPLSVAKKDNFRQELLNANVEKKPSTLATLEQQYQILIDSYSTHVQQMEYISSSVIQKQQQYVAVFSLSLVFVFVNILFFLYLYASLLRRRKLESENYQKDMEDEHRKIQLCAHEKSNLLRMLNQEIRSPLQEISGITDMLDKDLHVLEMTNKGRRKTDQSWDKRLDLLSTSVTHLIDVLDDVVSYTEIESGEVDLKKDPVDIHDFIKNLYKHFEPVAKSKKLSFNVKLGKEVPRYLYLDSGRLRQVLVHLIKNAFKYTQKGGVILGIGIIQKLPESDSRNDFLSFTLHDTGCGMNDADQERINSAMSHDVSNTSNFATSCLGMAITQKLIVFMQGDFTLKSEVNKGTDIQLDFPLQVMNKKDYLRQHAKDAVGDNNHIANALQPSQPNDAGQKTILIAEDIDSNAELLSWMLEDLGYQVILSENGVDCIDKLKSNDIDLIFMDQFMPVMDGQRATLQIRCLASKKSQVPIVGCTADTQRTTESMLLDVGQNRVLRKPMQLDAIKMVLDDLINKPEGPGKMISVG